MLIVIIWSMFITVTFTDYLRDTKKLLALYFQKINHENEIMGSYIRWTFSSNLFWIEVKNQRNSFQLG